MESLISPPASVASPAPSNANTPGTVTLPQPRQHPLRPGSEKEIALINYLDGKMRRLSRRYGKKFTDANEKDDSPGYTGIDQVIADIDSLIDVAWVSGTPHLQVSYLLSLAGILLSYMPAFEFSTSIFRPLTKLDLAFVALLQPQGLLSAGADFKLSMTDKVRIKSLIEETRVAAVNCASLAGHSASIQDLSPDDDSGPNDDEGILPEDGSPMNDEALGMALAKVYKRSLEILGDSLADVLV